MAKKDVYPPGWTEEQEKDELASDAEERVGLGGERYEELQTSLAEIKGKMEQPAGTSGEEEEEEGFEQEGEE